MPIKLPHSARHTRSAFDGAEHCHCGMPTWVSRAAFEWNFITIKFRMNFITIIQYLIYVPEMTCFTCPIFKLTILNFMCSIGLVSENYVPEISGPYNTNSSWPEQKGDNVTNYLVVSKLIGVYTEYKIKLDFLVENHGTKHLLALYIYLPWSL